MFSDLLGDLLGVGGAALVTLLFGVYAIGSTERCVLTTAAMKQDGENKVALFHSDAEKKASRRLGEAQAVRPSIVGDGLA